MMNYFTWILILVVLSLWSLGAWAFWREMRDYLEERRDRD